VFSLPGLGRASGAALAVRDMGAVQLPYLLRETRSERDSNPRYRLTRYTASPDRPSGVQARALGGSAYSKFAALGAPQGRRRHPRWVLRWDSFQVRLECPAGTRSPHFNQAPQQVLPVR
jgi:hypothetical protein